jgi:hypothetical protein
MIRNAILLALILLAACNRVSAGEEAKPGWIVGTWVLCEDPDHSPKDSLRFNTDGTGLLIRAKGNVELLHKQAGRSVSLLANVNGHAIPIEMSASTEFDKLVLHSDRTGNTSFYIRADNPAAATCSIK